MPGFDEKSAARISDTVLTVERAKEELNQRIGNFHPDNANLVYFKNVEAGAIPPYSCVRMFGRDTANIERGSVTVKKPNAYGSQYSHIITGQDTIQPQGESAGRLAVERPVWAAFNPTDSDGNRITPAVGEAWGPLNDSWVLNQFVGGYEVVAVDLARTLIKVIRNPLIELEVQLDESLASLSTADATPRYWDGSAWALHSNETVSIRDSKGIGGIIAANSLLTAYWNQSYKGWIGVSRGCTVDAS